MTHLPPARVTSDDSFSPAYGESWSYPEFEGVSEFTLILRDVSNVTVLEKQVSLGEETDWNGQLENGTTIEKGVYFVEIKSDQETYAMGTITVVK